MAVLPIRPRDHLLVGHRQKGGLRCYLKTDPSSFHWMALYRRKSRCRWRRRLLIWRQTKSACSTYPPSRSQPSETARQIGLPDEWATRVTRSQRRRRGGRDDLPHGAGDRRQGNTYVDSRQGRQPGHAGRPRHAARAAGPSLPRVRAALGARCRHAGAPPAASAPHRRAARRQLRIGAFGRGGVDAGVAVERAPAHAAHRRFAGRRRSERRRRLSSSTIPATSSRRGRTSSCAAASR